MKLLLALLLLLAGSVLAGERHSGYVDASPATRAMQDDDAANPGFLWVQQGQALWQEGERSCASCHGHPTAMAGVAARYPTYDRSLGRPISLAQRIRRCRTQYQGEADLAPDSDALLALAALVGLQSRGMPVAVDASGPAAAHAAAGERLFNTRKGQLNLSSASCHDTLAGRHLAGSVIPQGHPTGYPIYRLEWQTMGSLSRRLRNCTAGMRAEPFAPDSLDLADLEFFLGRRASGLLVDTPAVRP